MTRLATMLRVLIGVHLVWTFLLTPVALEPRPFSVINPIGYLSLALIFTIVTLDIVGSVRIGARTVPDCRPGVPGVRDAAGNPLRCASATAGIGRGLTAAYLDYSR